MEISEFITSTLVGIQKGVSDAIQKTSGNDLSGVINPSWGTHENIGANLIEKVEFDIAVTVTDKTQDDLSGGIKVMGVNLGASTGGSQETGNVSRIKFSIPIIPPVTTVKISQQ